jgi:hypothetical protein
MAKIEYNNYGKTLKKLAGKIPPGQIKTFVLLSKKWKKDEQGETKYDKWVGIGPKRVPNECTIMDVDSQEPVQIGYVKGYDEDGRVRLGEIVFLDTNGGEITCLGGHADDQKLYQFLKLCDWNESNPRRDQAKRAIFKEIDPVRDEEAEGEAAMVLAQAMGIFSAMTASEKKAFCEEHDLAHIGTDAQINARISKFINKQPETFINLMDDSSGDMLRTINIAWKETKVIKNHHKLSQWEWSDVEGDDKVIMKYKKDFGRGGTVDKKLLDWIMANPKGMNVLRRIEEKNKEVEG